MKSKLRLFVALLLCFAALSTAKAQKMVGYLPSYTDATVLNTTIQYNKLTDVIFCFINPDASGTGALVLDRVGSALFDFEMEKFQIVKSKCYPMTDNGPKLWIALGGADLGNVRAARIAALCASGAGRTNLANALVNFAITHELEGIDLDWEFPSAGAQATSFSQFIVELRARINASSNTNLKIGVAVGGETIGSCGAGHLAYFDATVAGVVAAVDYFHIMTYDLPPSYNANHSTLANSNTSLNDWSSCKSIPKSKMLMGVPFYGRNAARTAIQNYNAMGAGANAGDNVGGTYYYNGDATIAAKIDAVRTTHNAAGIMIWDVAMDKTHASGQSLLSAAYVKMFGNAANNPCSTIPYMGKDTTKCSGQNLTLDPVVNATSGAGTRTFAWTRNGAAIGGSTNTLVATQAGTYRVTVTQGPSNCVLTDEIVVSEQTDAPTPGASPTVVCSSGPASSTLSSASSVQWFTSATGGAPFATGTSTSVSPTVTTTYYTQGAATPTNKRYFAGKPALTNNTAMWNERTRNVANDNPEWVQQFTVLQPLTLRSVVVYFASNATHNPVRIRVMDATVGTGTTLATVPTQVSANQTAPITVPARATLEPWTGYPVIVNVNITFQPGTYYVGVYNSDGHSAPEYAILQTATSFPTGHTGVYSIGGNAHQNYGGAGGYGAAGTHYGQLFDWRIESAALSQCTRKTVVVTHDCAAPVELLGFTGYHSGGKNHLDWSTAMEQDNDYFNVERSSDGTSFEVIGTRRGAGNTSSRVDYTLTDHEPLEGKNYYRLAQYDFDGTRTYSNVVLLNNMPDAWVYASPNPFEHVTTIHVRNISQGVVSVQDVYGNTVYRGTIQEGAADIQVGAGLSAGVYLVNISGSNVQQSLKIVKQ